MLGPDGRSMPVAGPAMPMPAAGPTMPLPSPAAPGAAAPGMPAEENVVEVRVEGNRTIGLDKILPKIRTRAGRAYIEEQVQTDVRELSKLGTFANVQAFHQRVPTGIVVIFRVVERPLFQEVTIVGNDTYLTSVLKKEAEVKVGDAADPFAVENGRRKIEDYYKKKGYSKVRVTILEGNKAGDLRAVFLVNEGPQQKIFWVSFVGNQFVSSARLKTLIESHPPYFYLFAGEVDHKQIDEDEKKLIAYYRGFGFFHARIGRELQFNEKQNWLTITFVIDEGPRYSVRNVSFLGNKKIENSRLAEKLKLLSGMDFDQNQQNLDLQKLRDEYGGNGYVFAKIEADNRFLEEPGKLDIVYNVDEGSRYRVGRLNIEIKGENPHTQIMTVLNRLSFKPGDIVDTREFQASERRLKAAPLYKVEPQKGIEPKIVYSPPESEDKDTMVAGQRRTSYYRVPGGEAPLPPGEGYLDVNVSAESQAPEADVRPQDTPYPRAAYPQPTFQGQTFQQSPCTTRVCLGQAYPPPPYPPQVPQTSVRFQTRYEPNDVWAQPQPQQQGQSWPSAGYANSGSNGGQPQQSYSVQQPPPQNYPAQQSYAPQQAPPQGYFVQQPPPSAAPMYYNPPSAAPFGATSAAPPGTYPAVPAYGAAPSYGAPAGTGPAYAYPSSPAAANGSAMGGPSDGQGLYTPAGPAASRTATEVGAAGDLFSNPDPTMIPTPTGEPLRDLPIRISPEETQTGRLMFGVGVNSDAGLVGNITLDEQNFDWTKVPESWEDIVEGRAFRGAGERFRLELAPGTQVQRYLISFQEPYAGYLENKPVGLGLSGSYYQRIYTQWTESRVGGTVSLQYQFTHDLQGSVGFQGQNVDIKNPEYPVPSLEEVLGHNQLYTFSLSLQHNTRDNDFLASEGHLLSGALEETVGTFQYARATVKWSQFFRIFERADRSGKHVLSLNVQAGYSGDNTPIFERYYAGGFSTIRGFAFRGVTPRDPVYGMGVGGDFQMLSTAQYLFPITADDMLRGVVFVDAGTVEPTITQWVDKVRVAPGFGLRISIPMMGPAPIALDFAFPINQQNGDQTQIFSFFVGFNH